MYYYVQWEMLMLGKKNEKKYVNVPVLSSSTIYITLIIIIVIVIVIIIII